MKWLDPIEAKMLEYIATVPLETRRAAEAFMPNTPEWHSFGRLEKRELIVMVDSGIDPKDGMKHETFKVSPIAALIRNVLKNSMSI